VALAVLIVSTVAYAKLTELERARYMDIKISATSTQIAAAALITSTNSTVVAVGNQAVANAQMVIDKAEKRLAKK
jgi:uncharacterized membrane protein YiaA